MSSGWTPACPTINAQACAARTSAQIDDTAKAFIESRDMFFLSSVDPDGRPTVSYKGGDPGFVDPADPLGLFGRIYTRGDDPCGTDVKGLLDPNFLIRRYADDTGAAVAHSLENPLSTLWIK